MIFNEGDEANIGTDSPSDEGWGKNWGRSSDFQERDGTGDLLTDFTLKFEHQGQLLKSVTVVDPEALLGWK